MAIVTIQHTIEKTIRDILEYESDTFSAEGSAVTRAEAEAMTAKILADNIDCGVTVDGIELTEALEAVRG